MKRLFDLGISGTSSVKELRDAGIRVRFRASRITEGIELIRSALLSASGQRKLFISSRCSRLIEALECYHYPSGVLGNELPEKDGVYDHPIDALRYFFVNMSKGSTCKTRLY